jgi:hypothetical protein
MLTFCQKRDVHFVASGHEKRRIPKEWFWRYASRGLDVTPMDRFHDRMIQDTFRVFCRDPAFEALVDQWGSEFSPETQGHVPAIRPHTALGLRLRTALAHSSGNAHDGVRSGTAPIMRVIQEAPLLMDYMMSRAAMWLPRHRPVRPAESNDPTIIVSGRSCRLSEVVSAEVERGVHFHRVGGPEWFGCATIHLVSRVFLERLSEKLDRFGIYDVLDLPFVGTPLEVIWGFLPEWLGFDKWFTDGFHRVRKHFVTYQREDYPSEMASYINRYHQGRVAVSWRDDFLDVRALHPELSYLRAMLPAIYFQPDSGREVSESAR